MSGKPNDGNYSAFPVTYDPTGVRTPGMTADGAPVIDDGMSIRQYAAIHLRVPRSGHAWLDEMIRESQRDEFAGQAMQAILSNSGGHGYSTWADLVRDAYAIADAMLAARNPTT